MFKDTQGNFFSPDQIPHPIQNIFQVPQERTKLPVVLDAFTGSGKTYKVVQFLAERISSYQHLQGKYIVAFKEVQLAVEAAVDFYETLRVLGLIGYRSHVVLHFGVTDEHIADYESKVKADPSNKKLAAILNFMRHTTANTNLTKEKQKTLGKARVIFTTHESMLTLGRVKITHGRHCIWDEAPSNYYHFLEHTHMGQLKSLAAASTAFKRESTLREFTRISNLVECGLKRYSPTWTRADKSEMCCAFVDFKAFGAESITLMSAFTKGTSIAVLEALSGESFIWADSPDSQTRIDDCLRRVVFGRTETLSSTSKAKRGSDEAKAAVKEMTSFGAKYRKHAFFIGHAWAHNKWKGMGLPVCKLNQTGLNTLKDRSAAIVGGLSFLSPINREKFGFVFGDRLDEFQDNLMGAELMQSLMRGNLRDRSKNDLFLVVYGDERVVTLFEKACKVTGIEPKTLAEVLDGVENY